MGQAQKLARPAGLVLLLLGAALHFGTRDGERPTARLQPDVEGELDLVVGYVASARQSALRNAHLVTEVVNGLPTDARVLLATNDRDAFSVKNPWPDRVRFVELSAERTFTIWPQDPFVVLIDEDGTRSLLASREFERANDAWFPQELGAALDWPVRVSELSFEGGNMVADEDTVFIGANTVLDNALGLETSEPEIVRLFEEELGVGVLVVGPAPQPVGHIDMMLTPLGRGRLMVADPRAGAALARQALSESPSVVAEFERGCEASFFGHPSIRALVSQTGERVEPPPVEGATASAIEATEAIADTVDMIARSFADRGYTVERVPFLFDEPSWRDGESTPGPGYPTLTYNNVLLERRESGEVVYLPRYGFGALDEAAERAWTDVGFRVHLIDGLTVSAMYGGSLRCCIKVLSRRP